MSTEPFKNRQGDAATALFTAIILILGVAVGAWKLVTFVSQKFYAHQPQDSTVLKSAELNPNKPSQEKAGL